MSAWPIAHSLPPKTPRRDWRAAQLKKEREGCCRYCGAHDEKLDAAHIIPRSLGGDQHELATVPLCRNHHQQFDAHELDLMPVLTHAEMAHAVELVGMFAAWHAITGERPEIRPAA